MRDLQTLASWAAREARTIGRHARERHGWLALACGLLAWALAYQAPLSYQLHIGGDQATLRQRDDEPFLRDFNASEPPNLFATPELTPYRWSRERSAIVLPGLGARSWLVHIRAASSRPDGSPARSVWSDGISSAALTVDAQPRSYTLLARTSPAGDLTLTIDTPPFAAPGDPRTLGLALFRVSLTPNDWLVAPAAGQLGWLALALALIYLLARRIALAPQQAFGLATLAALAAAGALAFARMAITPLAPRLAPILLGCYLVALLGAAAYRRLIDPALHDRPLVVGLVALALALRLGGMLHPHAIFSDAGLNTHNLAALVQGELLFTEGLPAEAGGGRVPYPPGQYVALAPFQLLLPAGEPALGLLVKAGNALADSLVVVLLWFMVRRAGFGERAALLAGGLYLLPPPLLKSLSVGEFANVFGQALALLAVGYAALNARRLAEPRVLAGMAALLAAALLGHLGVTISLFCAIGYLGLALLVRRETRPSLGGLLLAGALAGALVGLLYYTPFADVLSARASGPAPADTAARSLTERLAGELNLARILRLEPLLLALGAIGIGLAGARGPAWRHPWPRPAFGTLLSAWWGGSLLSLGLLLFASQGVRWQAFLYPALCLGAGPALARLWPAGRAGRLVALALAAFLIAGGLEFWVAQIRDYLHA